MNFIFNDLILEICDCYDEKDDKNNFDDSSLIECKFIDNLKEKLDELNVEYNDSKLDFLAKWLLVRYNYDKISLLMSKKYMGNPNENNGRVSNSVVSDFCLSLKKKNADEIRNIEDEFYIKACNFSQDEKNSIFNNLDRNVILEEKFGVDSDAKDKLFYNYNKFPLCWKGTLEALKLKELGIKEYHKKLLNGKQNSHQYRKVIRG